jgi:hypothetical protein
MTEILSDDLKTKIYEIYTEVKKYLKASENQSKSEEENQDIYLKTELPILIENLKKYTILLIDEKTKNNNDNSNDNNNIVKQLENYIKKLENDVRFFIKKIFHYKIKNDSLEMKIKDYIEIEEEYEELKEKVKYEDGKFMDNDRKDNEINILRRENSNIKKEISKLENKIKELEEYKFKYNEDEEIIKQLKNKIKQLNKKISELEDELNNAKINLNNISNNNEINSNQFNIIDYNNMKLDKFNLGNKSNLQFRHDVTNYQFPKNSFNLESNKTNTLKSNDSNKLIISAYNKIYNKNIISPLRKNNNSNIYQNLKKINNNSVSMREDNEQSSEIISKYLSGSHSNNKYFPHIKVKSLTKLGNKMLGYKFPKNNIGLNKKYINKENNHYENSVLNIIGINKKI